MATLTEKQRDKMAKSDFGLPEERKYPMPDKSHAGTRRRAPPSRRRRAT